MVTISLPISDHAIKAKSKDMVTREGVALTCVHCIVTAQCGEEDLSSLRTLPESAQHRYIGSWRAITVYEGEAVCLEHFNTVRGNPKVYNA